MHCRRRHVSRVSKRNVDLDLLWQIFHCSPLPKSLMSTCSTFKEARRKRTSLRGDRKDEENCCTSMMALALEFEVYLSSRMRIFTRAPPFYLTEYGIARNSVNRHVPHHVGCKFERKRSYSYYSCLLAFVSAVPRSHVHVNYSSQLQLHREGVVGGKQSFQISGGGQRHVMY